MQHLPRDAHRIKQVTKAIAQTLEALVMDVDLQPIKGLYAAGEVVGGLYYGNYPGGCGLMSGAVFGKIAGEAAAA